MDREAAGGEEDTADEMGIWTRRSNLGSDEREVSTQPCLAMRDAAYMENLGLERSVASENERVDGVEDVPCSTHAAVAVAFVQSSSELVNARTFAYLT